MILGITGTIGAGKGTVVDYLVGKGFKHYSVREAITEEIVRRGLPVNRDTMNEVATDMRKKHGASYFGDVLWERAAADGAKDFIIESIRTTMEANRVKSKGGFILVVDAPEAVRYERIRGRGSETDSVSLEEFRKQEAREMTSENPDDPSYMNIRGVMDMKDATIVNDGTLEELGSRVDAALAALGG